jgi:hypothetical protein
MNFVNFFVEHFDIVISIVYCGAVVLSASDTKYVCAINN